MEGAHRAHGQVELPLPQAGGGEGVHPARERGHSRITGSGTAGPGRGSARIAAALVDAQRSNRSPARRVEAQASDGRPQQSFVRCELLERTTPGARLKDGHEVAGLHPLVHETVQGLPSGHRASETQAEIIHDEDHRAANGLSAIGFLGSRARGATGGGRPSLERHIGTERDVLAAAVLQDLEIRWAEIGDLAAVLGGHHGVHLDHFQADAHDRSARLGFARPFGLLPGGATADRQAGHERDQSASTRSHQSAPDSRHSSIGR